MDIVCVYAVTSGCGKPYSAPPTHPCGLKLVSHDPTQPGWEGLDLLPNTYSLTPNSLTEGDVAKQYKWCFFAIDPYLLCNQYFDVMKCDFPCPGVVLYPC